LRPEVAFGQVAERERAGVNNRSRDQATDDRHGELGDASSELPGGVAIQERATQLEGDTAGSGAGQRKAVGASNVNHEFDLDWQYERSVQPWDRFGRNCSTSQRGSSRQLSCPLTFRQPVILERQVNGDGGALVTFDLEAHDWIVAVGMPVKRELTDERS
jgi:hypothetical protein